MITLLIVFITSVCAGLGFWFYNRRHVKNLTEEIDDKNVVIGALRNHVEESSLVPTNFDANDSWRGGNTQTNLTPSVEEALGNKQKKNNRHYKKSGDKKTSQKGQSSNSNKTSENKNRPKPRKKNKPTE
jgi:hypothetical protein